MHNASSRGDNDAMADKELRHLSRKELIEIIYEYQKREVQFQDAVDTLTGKLKKRELQMKEAGSIANAALSINAVFEAAQAAADQYLASVKALDSENNSRTQQMLTEAQEQADSIVQKGKETYQAWVRKGEEEYQNRVSQAEAECKRIRDDMCDYILLHNTLKELYEESGEVSNYA